MNKINFQNRESKLNIFITFILTTGIIINTLIVFDIYYFENPKIQKIFSAVIYLLVAVYLSRIFWFKNIFKWNRKGFSARINNFWGINRKFKNINNFELEGNTIIIKEINGNQNVINLENIDAGSRLKLVEILESKIN